MIEERASERSSQLNACEGASRKRSRRASASYQKHGVNCMKRRLTHVLNALALEMLRTLASIVGIVVNITHTIFKLTRPKVENPGTNRSLQAYAGHICWD